MAEDESLADPIAELITSYFELNSVAIDELDEEPSPLEFMRYVARNTPFVVRGAASSWKSTKTWSTSFLKEFLGQVPVNVAVTPQGNADSPTPYGEDGNLVFAKPWEEEQPFPEFLDYVIDQERDPSAPLDAEVRYAQTQNDNLRHEYSSLFSHVQRDIAFARIALARDPEAINLWIGNARSVTALHKDNYENVYVQIRGRKHFVLLPPLCHPCVNEQSLRPATYARRRDATGTPATAATTAAAAAAASGLDLDLVPEDGEHVPFAVWDPDTPARNATPYSHLAQPTRVTLEPGDMLYLPAMWYHKVSQSCSEEGICVAVNYWYDMEFSGPLYPLTTFVRSVHRERETQLQT